MIQESVTDFRHVIEEKLKAKKDALDQTEQTLKKFSVLREPSNNANFNAQGPQSGKTFNRALAGVRSRLGPEIKPTHGGRK